MLTADCKLVTGQTANSRLAGKGVTEPIRASPLSGQREWLGRDSLSVL